MNLAVLERSVRLVVAESGSAPAARVFFMLRLLLVFGAIAVALGPFGARPLPFVAGLSIVVPAVIWHGLSTAHGR